MLQQLVIASTFFVLLMASEAISFDGEQVMKDLRLVRELVKAPDYSLHAIQRERTKSGQPAVPVELICFSQRLYKSSVKDLLPNSLQPYNALSGRDFIVLAGALPGAFLPYIFDSPEETFSIDVACQAANEVLPGLNENWFDQRMVGKLQKVTYRIASILKQFAGKPNVLTPICKALRSFLHQDRLEEFQAALGILLQDCEPAADAIYDIVIAFRKRQILPKDKAALYPPKNDLEDSKQAIEPQNADFMAAWEYPGFLI